jgi:DNA-binding CsgD family transcriptional regulator
VVTVQNDETSAAILDLVSDSLEALGSGDCAEHVICRRIADLLCARVCGYLEIEAMPRRCSIIGWPPAFDVSRLIAVIENNPEDCQVMTHLRDGGACAPTTIAALVGDQSAWRRSAGFAVLRDDFGCTEGAIVPVLTTASRVRMIGLVRNAAFSDRELDQLKVAQRPLVALDRHLRQVTPPRERAFTTVVAPDEASVASGFQLTRREFEVLELLAQGLLARAIASQLSVSQRTVHSHLASLYRKLGTHDRLVAVTRAQSVGLLAGAPGLS